MGTGSSSLRVALLVYRGNPHSGGQGVYTRYLSRELIKLGHRVTVFAGQPWPRLDPGVEFVGVPSLDLYRPTDPFRVPRLSELRSPIDVAEFALMCSAGFPEPLTFSWRVRRQLAARAGAFDVVHDNQTFGTGLLGVMADGWPVLGTCHHPITVDRDLELGAADGWRRRLTLRRWYGFLSMQKRVARAMPRILTVSESSRRDIAAQMGVDATRVAVVPIGADHVHFSPDPAVAVAPGRIMTTASADVPLKGLATLLEALAKVRAGRPEAHLVVVGRLRADSPVALTIRRLGLDGAVTFVAGISDDRLVELYRQAAVVVVPSLYEGFSLPAVEAMASGAPLVATTGGALPEVVGTDGQSGLLVAPGDPGALMTAIEAVLSSPELAAKLAANGRRRAVECFGWRRCAEGTVEQYRWVIDHAARRRRFLGARGVLTVRYDDLGLRAGDRLLDLGTGGGRHAFEAMRRGAVVTAVDADRGEVVDAAAMMTALVVDDDATRAAGGQGGGVCGDALRLPFPDATFDRVIAAEVLEHIPDDGVAMGELARVLRPGGTLAVTVPRFYPERVNWALSAEYHLTPGGHVRIYRFSELVEQLSAAGLECYASHHAHALHSPYWWLKSAVGVSNDTHPAVRLYHRLLVWDITAGSPLTRVPERALNPLLGKSLVVYVKKPAS